MVSGRWQPATDAGAERARAAIVRLSQPKGPVFETLPAGDLVSLAASEVASRVGGSADSIAAKVDADRLSVRARVDFASLRGKLGPLASMLGDRETVELTGRFQMLKPGLGEFEVLNARVGQMTLPQGVIPRLLQEIDHGTRPAGLRTDALPLPMPGYVSDIRIANGKVTLYKNVKSMARRILIVDDEQGIRAALGQLLEFEGYEVQTAANAVDGLAEYATLPSESRLHGREDGGHRRTRGAARSCASRIRRRSS